MSEAIGYFTRRAESVESIRERLEAQRQGIAEAARGHEHEHDTLVSLGVHCDLVAHLIDEHGLDLPLSGIGTTDLKRAHEASHR